jgi:hypothetical protein
MGDESAVFEFEKDFAQSLRCIPMSVRLKLDTVGVKVSLKQWNRLGAQERHSLLQLPCDAGERGARYRDAVRSMVRERTGEDPEMLPAATQPAWLDDSQVPEQIRTHMGTLGLPPLSQAQWVSLGPVRRFALLKLSRPGHRNENFLPALREFGLAAAER